MGYDFNDVGDAILLIFDELKRDKESKGLIKRMDGATGDQVLKECLREGVKRLRMLDKNVLADEIEKKTKGFAF